MIARYLVSRLYIIGIAMVRGLYPGVGQKSPDIDLMFGLHKQRIENVDTGVTPEARQWLSQPNKY